MTSSMAACLQPCGHGQGVTCSRTDSTEIALHEHELNDGLSELERARYHRVEAVPTRVVVANKIVDGDAGGGA